MALSILVDELLLDGSLQNMQLLYVKRIEDILGFDAWFEVIDLQSNLQNTKDQTDLAIIKLFVNVGFSPTILSFEFASL